VVRVTCYVARVPAGNLARNAAERVPDGVLTAVFCRGAFNLIAAFARSARGVMVGVCFGFTNLAVAKPHRKSLGRYEFDMLGLADGTSVGSAWRGEGLGEAAAVCA
jgi:hypothetical protein